MAKTNNRLNHYDTGVQPDGGLIRKKEEELRELKKKAKPKKYADYLSEAVSKGACEQWRMEVILEKRKEMGMDLPERKYNDWSVYNDMGPKQKKKSKPSDSSFS